MAIRDRLLRIVNNLGGSEKLSDALFKEDLFPNEYAPIVATAEHTGDMPGAFDQLSRISQVEFDASQTYARQKSARWGCTVSMAVSGILLIIICWFYFRVLWTHMFNVVGQ